MVQIKEILVNMFDINVCIRLLKDKSEKSFKFLSLNFTDKSFDNSRTIKGPQNKIVLSVWTISQLTKPQRNRTKVDNA